MILNLSGVRVEVRQYVGVGVLRVSTTRGEVNCQSTDWIANFPDGVSCVLPDVTIRRLITGQHREDKRAALFGQEEAVEKSPDEVRYDDAVGEIVEKLDKETETILEIDEAGKVIEVSEETNDPLASSSISENLNESSENPSSSSNENSSGTKIEEWECDEFGDPIVK